MSAIIYHFPSKPEAKSVKRKKLPKARPAAKDVRVVIEVDRLRNFRIFGSHATKCLVSANWDLYKLIERSEAGEQPTNEELTAILNNIGIVIRSFDCADKFMLVNGQAVNKDDRFDELFERYTPAVRNQLTLLEGLESLLDRF